MVTGSTNAGRRRSSYSGSTAKAYGSAILGASFWKPDTEIAGIYLGSFETVNGKAHKFKCAVPSKLTVYVDDAGRVVSQEQGGAAKDIDQFSMGGLAGFLMALDDMTANGWKGFELHDRVWIKCVGSQPAIQVGHSDMLLFEVSVE